jgi:hypothetical protein
MWAFTTCCRVNFTFYHQFRDSAYICGRKSQDSFPILGVGGARFLIGQLSLFRRVVCSWNIANFLFCSRLHSVPHSTTYHSAGTRHSSDSPNLSTFSVLSAEERHGTRNNQQWKYSWRYRYTTVQCPTCTCDSTYSSTNPSQADGDRD